MAEIEHRSLIVRCGSRLLVRNKGLARIHTIISVSQVQPIRASAGLDLKPCLETCLRPYIGLICEKRPRGREFVAPHFWPLFFRCNVHDALAVSWRQIMDQRRTHLHTKSMRDATCTVTNYQTMSLQGVTSHLFATSIIIYVVSASFHLIPTALPRNPSDKECCGNKRQRE